MKPLNLKLNNFGPFLNETINFSQIENNELFLISGKTGSGKTMIFDAIVYSLFGEASTKNRKEGDLRSHFANGKEPMSVTYEFKLNNQTFKIHREAPFIKEGNTTKTQAKLDIYELKNDVYELRESRVNAGNQFITKIMGVNAEQFRQLFILPQGEFKKFLQSNSKEKQSILRTLFNSERFEEIQKYLIESVKEEKLQIENRYNEIDYLWNELNTFKDDYLFNLKGIESSQTEKILEHLPDFIKHGKNILTRYKKQKDKLNQEIEKITDEYTFNKELNQNINSLETKKKSFENLKQNQDSIDHLKIELKKIRESNVLINYFKRQKVVNREIEELEREITKSKSKEEEYKTQINNVEKTLKSLESEEQEVIKINEYLEKTYNFYNNLDDYIKAFEQRPIIQEELNKLEKKYSESKEKKEKLLNQAKGKTRNYEIIDQYVDEINKFKNLIDDTERYLEREEQVREIQQEQSKNEKQIQELKIKYANIENIISRVDATNIDLNNKETFVKEIQMALSIGDTCPVCGNEIHSLGEHINFELIAENKKQLDELDKSKNSIKEDIIRLESKNEALTNRKKEINFTEQEIHNIDELKSKLQEIENAKSLQQKENQFLESIYDEEKKLNQNLHKSELDINNKKAQLEQLDTKLNDFEKITKFESCVSFKQYYENKKQEIQSFKERKETIKDQLLELKNNVNIESTNLKHYKQNLDARVEEDKQLTNNIKDEMYRNGFESYEEIEEAISLSEDKSNIEEKINDYNRQYQTYEIEISQLEKLVDGRGLTNLEDIETQLRTKNQELDQINSEVATIAYKHEVNIKNIDKIESLINTLNEELKEQKEIFLLTEILSGKNSHKLTLENYVLIYYLEKIIFQANQRLLTMSGNRYQLIRRQAVSQGFSGLEIDVFDFHSNRSRHISSLSGGETFQASLALALGLSEIVQQESGGINLESMFVDEGFGTLDQETLETALDTLINLKSSGRMVGIISHVSELKQRIPLILEVTTNQYQSETKFKRN
ncbi:SMC family ATPase [Staphylococcus capitis]|uniref:exonuclease subunit SbcC n=1 Tax=Staphylococcus capitis TaxID=29388 RepID=UPI00352F1CB0